MRFILLSFVFMGLGFYELSGGNDFNPEAARIAAIEARVAREELRKAELPQAVVLTAEAVEAAPARRVEENIEDTVTRGELNLVSFASVVADPAPAPTQATNWAPQDQIADDPEPIAISALAETVAEERSIVFPGTVIGAASGSAEDKADIRAVTGSLVNMRSGPGTGYDVVGQLSQDTQVEVLGDSGTGWVELRPVDGGPTGWMADFLLSSR